MTGLHTHGTAHGLFVNPLIADVTGRFIHSDAIEGAGGVANWPNSRGSASEFGQVTQSLRPTKGASSIIAASGDTMRGGTASEYFSLAAGAFVFRVNIIGAAEDRMLQQAPNLVVRVAVAPRTINVVITDSGGTPGLALTLPAALTSLMVRWDSTDLEAKFEGGSWGSTPAGAIVSLAGLLDIFAGSNIEVSHLYTWDVDKTREHLEAVAAELP